MLLAPYASRVPASFQNVVIDPQRYESILADMQKMRGRIYLEDGAIGHQQLASDGRHCSPVDPESWHLLTLDDRRIRLRMRSLPRASQHGLVPGLSV